MAKAETRTADASQLPGDMAHLDEDLMPELTADIAVATAEMTEEQKAEYIADVNRVRSQRSKNPFGSMVQKLALPDIPGYKQHWFNDSPGRLDEAEQGGWTNVQSKEKKPVRRVVGSDRSGGPLYAYAMKIPTRFWEEDMARRHKLAQERMDDIKKNPIRAPSGAAQASDKDKFYSPREEAVQIRETAVKTRPR